MIAQYTQAAMVAENRRLAAPGERRLAADERDAGGPRVDGLGRGAQAAHVDRRTWPASSRSSWSAAARGLDLRAPLEPGAGTGAALGSACGAGVAGPGPDRWLAPELGAVEGLVASGALLAPSRLRSEELR